MLAGDGTDKHINNKFICNHINVTTQSHLRPALSQVKKLRQAAFSTSRLPTYSLPLKVLSAPSNQLDVPAVELFTYDARAFTTSVAAQRHFVLLLLLSLLFRIVRFS